MATWLVVEDEPELMELFAETTEQLGVNSVIFPSGEDALDWIEDVARGRFGGDRPDLALLDLRLTDGVSAVRVGAGLRDCAPLRDMTLVLLTANHLSPAWGQTVLDQSGADLLLYKPLPAFNDLRRLLQTLVRQ